VEKVTTTASNSTIPWQNRGWVLEASSTEELPLLATSIKMETTTSLHAKENTNIYLPTFSEI